jgi:hypothetical protein
MKFPPWLACVRLGSWTLWLPLVLLWPLWLLTFALIFALGGIAAFVMRGESVARFGAFAAALYQLPCELRGTRMSLEGPHEAPHRIVINLY